MQTFGSQGVKVKPHFLKVKGIKVLAGGALRCRGWIKAWGHIASEGADATLLKSVKVWFGGKTSSLGLSEPGGQKCKGRKSYRAAGPRGGRKEKASAWYSTDPLSCFFRGHGPHAPTLSVMARMPKRADGSQRTTMMLHRSAFCFFRCEGPHAETFKIEA